jgi:hypothetical protein
MADEAEAIENTAATAPRKRGGAPLWRKGGPSPNPGGRPAVIRDLREAARGYSTEALETLAKVMRDEEAGPAARVAAAKELLDRGFGKPVQAVDVGVKMDVGQTAAEVLMRLTAAAKAAKAAAVIDVTPSALPKD